MNHKQKIVFSLWDTKKGIYFGNGYKIKKVRELKGFSQEYVAQKLKISQPAYSKIEFGETKINEDKIRDISKILEVGIDDLKSFDESFVFNNYKQKGDNFSHIINHLPEKLIEQYEARIQQLEDEVVFLRVMCKDKR